MIVYTVYLYIATFGANVRFCRVEVRPRTTGYRVAEPHLGLRHASWLYARLALRQQKPDRRVPEATQEIRQLSRARRNGGSRSGDVGGRVRSSC
jgi:hypothetical protein